MRWERSSRGTLFLRRQPKVTLGVVYQNDDATYSWKSRAHHQDEPSRFVTEDGAIQALYRALGLAA